MAQGDGAAVDVDLLAVPFKQLADGQRLTAKASLASIRSTSSSVQPARCSAWRQALTGPMPITDGSTPATAELTMRASTGSPSSRALSTRISRTAAAPSFSYEAFPAVTLPSAGRNAGRSWASCCSLVSGRGCSSSVTNRGGFCPAGR